jgi:hypothetical protein
MPAFFKLLGDGDVFFSESSLSAMRAEKRDAGGVPFE